MSPSPATRPPVAERLNLTPEALREVADVNVLSLTNFGWDGPYRDYALSETVLYAMGGEMFSHGSVDREPLKMGGTASLIQCGAMAALGALGAVEATEVHGITQRVDVSLFDVQLNSVDRRSSAIMAYRFSGQDQRAAGGGGPLDCGRRRRGLSLRRRLRRDDRLDGAVLAPVRRDDRPP